MSLFANNFDAFGLDIGDRSLKLAYIKKGGATPTLTTYGAVAVPAGVFEKGQIKKSDELAGYIKKLLQTARGKKIKTNFVHACLPETHTFIKLLTVASPSLGELPAHIREDLPNHFPVAPDDLYIDWQTVETVNETTYKVAVGAVNRAIAESFTAALLGAGLTPVSLQIEAEAILRSLLPQKDLPKTPIAAVDIGATRSSFILYNQGAIQFTVSLPLSGDGLTELIAHELKLELGEAERAKIHCGLDPACGEGIIAAIASPAVDELVEQINKSVAYYNEHFKPLSPVTSLILCGGGAHLKNLKEVLTEKLAPITVYLGNPLINLVKNLKSVVAKKDGRESLDFLNPDIKFEKIKIPEPIPSNIAVTYTTAIGLALSNIT